MDNCQTLTGDHVRPEKASFGPLGIHGYPLVFAAGNWGDSGVAARRRARASILLQPVAWRPVWAVVAGTGQRISYKNQI